MILTHFAIVGPRFSAIVLCVCLLFCVQFVSAVLVCVNGKDVVGEHFINISNKNVIVSSIKIVANATSFPYLYRPYICVVQGLS